MVLFPVQFGISAAHLRLPTSTLRFSMLLATSVGLLALLSGCYAGIVGAIYGIRHLAESGGGKNDELPSVSFRAAAPSFVGDSPDLIQISFKVHNEDEGHLGACVDFLDMNAKETEDAGPLPGSRCLKDLPNDTFVDVQWDALEGLGGRSALVKAVVTPMEDGKRGKPEETPPFRAGNTGPSILGLRLSNEGSRVDVGLDLKDKEGDRVFLSKIEVSSFEIPLHIADKQDFATSAAGERPSFSLQFKVLDAPPLDEKLRALGRPGFVGEVTVKVEIFDYRGYTSSFENSFFYNNNVLPSVEILPYQPGDLGSGIIPIHYLVFDPDKTPVDLRVEVDFQDGRVPQLATELPVFPSEGTAGLCKDSRKEGCILDPPRGRPDSPFHTFLWDAQSQPFSSDRVVFSIRADDRQTGVGTSQVLAGFELTPFSRRTDIVTGEHPLPLATGDYNGDGFRDLVVANQFSNLLSFLPGGRQGLSEIGKVDYQVGDFPVAVETGVFDHDGRPSVVVANQFSNSVSFLAGVEGGLSQAHDIPVGNAPQALAIGDFDQDGVSDVVVANFDSGTVSCLRGGPGGLSVTRKSDRSVQGAPTLLAAGDFDGNGDMDVVAANEGFSSVSFLPGGTTDGLSEKVRQDIAVGGDPVALATGDFEGDGVLDLVLANRGPHTVTFLRKKGEKAEGLSDHRRLDLKVAGNPIALATEDFDGDGALDLVVVNDRLGKLSYLRGSSRGLHGQGEDITVGGAHSALIPGDFDEDGVPDLLLLNREGKGSVEFLRGGAEGLSKARKQIIPTEESPIAMIAGDFNGDSSLDVAVASEFSKTVSYIPGDRDGLFEARRQDIKVGVFPVALATGDFDGDEVLDLVVANQFSSAISLLRGGRGGLSQGPKRDIGVGVTPLALAAGDFDGDAALDLVVANQSSNNLTYFVGKRERGGGLSEMETRKWDIPVGQFPSAFVTGDFNGDCVLDLVVANQLSSSLSYLRGGAGGLLEERKEEIEETPEGMGPVALVKGDFGGDGSLDLAVANAQSDNVTYIPGGSSEGFLKDAIRHIRVEDFPVALIAGDFDEDGALELVVANQDSNTLSYFRKGLSDDWTKLEAGDLAPKALAAGDFDGDGALDLTVANGGSIDDAANTGGVRCFYGGPDGLSDKENRRRDIKVRNSPSTLVTGDLDGDGFLDLVIAKAVHPGTLSYLRGGADGLSQDRIRDISVEDFPAAMAVGDFNGDGSLDLVVACDSGGIVSYFPTRYFVAHASCFVGPDASRMGPPCSLIDPRRPRRYRLELLKAFPTATQISALPATVFELPPFPTGRYPRVVTTPVAIAAIVREKKAQGEARLTLGFRELPQDLLEEIKRRPEGLKVFKKDPGESTTCRPETPRPLGVALETPLDLVDFDTGMPGGNTGVTFLIQEVGTYLVAFELVRSGG